MSQFSFEFAGSEVVAGVDEVGRGPFMWGCGYGCSHFRSITANPRIE